MIEKYQAKIREEISDWSGREYRSENARDKVRQMQRFASNLESDLRVELEELIQASLINTGDSLIKAYKNKLASLVSEIGVGNLEINIDPLSMMGGYIPDASSFSISSIERTRRVVTGYHEETTYENRRWWNPFSWFGETKRVNEYGDENYVRSGELAQAYFAPIEEGIYNNGRSARDYAAAESKKIAGLYKTEFKRLDNILNGKLKELKSYAKEKDKVKERIRETERNLAWLQDIKNRVDSILEI